MNRRGAGVAFCFMSVLLYSTRYISAAIFGSNVSSGLFNAMLKYVGSGLTTFSVIALIVGIVYLVIAERLGDK